MHLRGINNVDFALRCGLRLPLGGIVSKYAHTLAVIKNDTALHPPCAPHLAGRTAPNEVNTPYIRHSVCDWLDFPLYDSQYPHRLVREIPWNAVVNRSLHNLRAQSQNKSQLPPCSALLAFFLLRPSRTPRSFTILCRGDHGRIVEELCAPCHFDSRLYSNGHGAIHREGRADRDRQFF